MPEANRLQFGHAWNHKENKVFMYKNKLGSLGSDIKQKAFNRSLKRSTWLRKGFVWDTPDPGKEENSQVFIFSTISRGSLFLMITESTLSNFQVAFEGPIPEPGTNTDKELWASDVWATLVCFHREMGQQVERLILAVDRG